VRPFSGEAVDGRGYFLLTTARGNRQPKVSAFRTWLLRQFGTAR
jgi:DNA-binding transcriptional LysR family regulator